ncbi:MAG: VCBS repeat-containing protein [Bacteroidota bacterium]
MPKLSLWKSLSIECLNTRATKLFLLSLLYILSSCQKQKQAPLFEQMSSKTTAISFNNEVKNAEGFNIFNYRNFYNGGGVAIGDINNDGLSDIFLTANMGSNKLYLNQGNWQFQDISEQAGIQQTDKWSTGVVMVDINNDGWLDIYVCNAGYSKGSDQKNALFINQQDGTFQEAAAQYGLDENGYTTHAAFFDYDLDGDLDAYILNNSFMPVNTLNYSNKRELYAEDWPVKDFLRGGGDKLLRNDKGQFVDVSREANIYGSLIGFGLGITVGDLNNDHYPDLYISNDFFERDYLYINQQDGTFKESIKDRMEHISLASMGADMADINNDAYPEIFVTEMLPEKDKRRKETTRFENYNIYQLKQERDFYHQYMQNTLHLNNQDQSFSEIAYYSGVAASDWSWGALMLDADNDGFRDIYVCNGIYHDVTNQDFIDFFANDVVQEMALTGKKREIEEVINKMPSTPLSNKFFQNNQDLTFQDKSEDWGIATPSFSNGAAYGDLDNDGDLDLIVNNVNQEVFVYQNRAERLGYHYLGIKLIGTEANHFAIGAKVQAYQNDQILNAELIPSRGFQSSCDYKMLFGLGDNANVDSLVIFWTDRTKTLLQNIPTDTVLQIDYNQSERVELGKENKDQTTDNQLFAKSDIQFQSHQEEQFSDFYNEGLVMRSLAQEGPKSAVGDLNGDGLEDLVIGGAKGQPMQVYFQQNDSLVQAEQDDFRRVAETEDTAIALFDADGDGYLDIYAGSGGNFAKPNTPYKQDKLFLNDDGTFRFVPEALPQLGRNTSVALPFDYDNDGDLDIFVGSRSMPGNYGTPVASYIFENNGSGKFTDKTKELLPQNGILGMITDAKWLNILGNEKEELIVVGEWMSPRVFALENGQFEEVKTDLNDYKGWWYALETSDLDGDGQEDLILGNRGENFYFTADKKRPAKLWLHDFDDNGTTEKVMTQSIDGRDMPIAMKAELSEQVVSLKKQNLRHEAYSNKAIDDLFDNQNLKRAYVIEANYFKSAVAINQGNGKFDMKPLPKEVQFSCVCDIHCTDLNGDGAKDLVLGGNDAGFRPQFSKLDASFGHVLINQNNGTFKRISNKESGFFVRGDLKSLQAIQLGEKEYLIATLNNKRPVLYTKR